MSETLDMEPTRCSHQRMKQMHGLISRREDYGQTTLDQIRYDERRVMGLFRVFAIALASEHIWSR